MNAETLIAHFKSLPAPSPSVIRLLGLLNRADSDIEAVLPAIKSDGELTAKLLAVCNSAAYGLAQCVGSVQQAVFYLGYREILRLVLAINFQPAADQKLAGYGIEERELWRHSLISATAAESVATQHSAVVAVDPSVAYTTGLLHDLGKVVLEQVLTPDLGQAIRRLVAQQNHSRLDAERAVLETDHCEVGALLLARWNLPETVVEAVAYHHHPPLQPHPRLSAIAHVADCVAHEIGSAPGWDGFAVAAEEDAAEALGIGPQDLERIVILTYAGLARIEEMIALA